MEELKKCYHLQFVVNQGQHTNPVEKVSKQKTQSFINDGQQCEHAPPIQTIMLLIATVKKNINSDEFRYFIDFYDAMYESYKELADTIGAQNTSLERLDNNKHYSKSNCIWIPKQNQQKHTSRIVKFEVTFPDGHTEIHQNIREFTTKYNLNDSTIQDCLNPNRSTKQHKNFKFKRL